MAGPFGNIAALVGACRSMYCTAHRVDGAGKFRWHAVAGGLVPGSKPGDPPVMLADLRIDQIDEMRLEAFVGAFLIGAHQARIARHIGGEDRSETAGRSHGCGSPPITTSGQACSGRRRAIPRGILRKHGSDAMTQRDQMVHSDPDILGGTPVFIGTRVPVRSLFDYLEGGDTLDEFLRQFPSVRREQAIAVLDLARESLMADARPSLRAAPGR